MLLMSNSYVIYFCWGTLVIYYAEIISNKIIINIDNFDTNLNSQSVSSLIPYDEIISWEKYWYRIASKL